MTLDQTISKTPTLRNRWFEGLMAILALLNLCLVSFDLSFIPWRNVYFDHVPSLTQLYDPIKGIEPHRETQRYLETVNQLEVQVAQTDLRSPQAESLLEELRRLSNEMIEDNPFAVANKSGALEKIKNQIRDRVHIRSAHRAFAYFWSQTHFAESGWQPEITFFNTQIRPLIQTNYYRGINTNGKFIDRFWLIDLPFVTIFGLEFLIRTFYISRRWAHLTWQQATLRRWYDVFLLLPVWRWLRAVPVIIRLYQARLLNLDPVRAQLSYEFVANFAEELTQIVGVRMINQMQESIRRGDMARRLFNTDRHPYLQVNQTDEVTAIATHLVNVSVYNVLPQLQPDIEDLVQHTLTSTLSQSPAYQRLQALPGLSYLPTQVSERLAKDLSQIVYTSLTDALEDPVRGEIAARLVNNFRTGLGRELQKRHNLQAIESLVIDLLEEIKINYVKGIAEEGIGREIEQTEQLRQTGQRQV